MKTYTALRTMAGNLTNNDSTQNLTTLGQLLNDQHRQLIQKYFDNERTVTFSTIGGESLTLTGSLASNATTATLTAAWTRITCQQYVNFSNGNQRLVQFTLNSTTITWVVGLTATATTAITTLGVQDYNIPGDISKIKNNTISVGQLKYQPTPVMSRQEWDTINFLPYTSDIPNYFFIYNGKLSIFPIPSTTGNVVTFNYKNRVPDFSFADYTTGTISGATASTAIVGSSTTWNSIGLYPLASVGFYNLYLRADPPKGDGIWYPISSFTSDSALVLSLPLVNPTTLTGATYTIGQMPLLSEDFHDMIVYGALKTYYSTVVSNLHKFKEVSGLYAERLELLKDYAGTKNVNVDLEAEPSQVNPNLFLYSSS